MTEAAALGALVRGAVGSQAAKAELIGPGALELRLLARPEGPTFIERMAGCVTEYTLRDCGVGLWDFVDVDVAPVVWVAVGGVVEVGVGAVSGVVRVGDHGVSVEQL